MNPKINRRKINHPEWKEMVIIMRKSVLRTILSAFILALMLLAFTYTAFALSDFGQHKTSVLMSGSPHFDACLAITKIVSNTDGSPLTDAQREQLFELKVEFSDGGTYTYAIYDDDETIVSEPEDLASGGTLKLAHGQTAIFPLVPDWVSYNVTEQAVDGYVPDKTGYSGEITEFGAFVVFISRFEPELPPTPQYTVTVIDSYAEVTGADNYQAAMTVTINAGIQSGYTFNGWTVLSGGVTLTYPYDVSTTFTMPANHVTVRANWTPDNDSPSPPPTVPTETTPEPSPSTDPSPEPSTDPDDINDADETDPPPQPKPQTTDDEPYTPGGTDINTPPIPMAPGHEMVEDGDGWLEFGDDGTPLGRWSWGEDLGEWVFTEYAPPLSDMPYTGVANLVLLYSIIMMLLVFYVYRLSKKIKRVK